MEAFDFAVGLGPVWPGPLVVNVEFSAGVTPGVGTVGAAVVGEQPRDRDPAIGEPGDTAPQQAEAVLTFSSV